VAVKAAVAEVDVRLSAFVTAEEVRQRTFAALPALAPRV
jgi:hypothetical protein